MSLYKAGLPRLTIEKGLNMKYYMILTLTIFLTGCPELTGENSNTKSADAPVKIDCDEATTEAAEIATDDDTDGELDVGA